MDRTVLNDRHRDLGGRMVEFAGWDMPLLYRGIVEEHVHTRTAASAFDVSHMGRLEFRGPDASAVLQRGVTRNLSKLAVGRCGYAHVCNEQGGVLDDVIVARYEDRWLMVCNASNRAKIIAHFRELSAGRNAAMIDQTTGTCMIAVQGPAAMSIFDAKLPLKLPADPRGLKRYGFVTGGAFGVTFSLFRTGYTGEDGFEIVVPAAVGPTVWDFLLGGAARGGPDVRPAGLGARDTLRLEAGMCLYGHELDEHVDPLTAGCGWCVDLTCDFVGAAALRAVAERGGPARKLTGLELEGRRIARQGAEVGRDATTGAGTTVGVVTSGTFGPTVGKSIALSFVDAAISKPGATLSVELGGSRSTARVVELPFHRRG